jgi:ParB-like chromosome segregation protein Spo0J
MDTPEYEEIEPIKFNTNIVMVETHTLIPYAQNAKLHSEEQVFRIGESIKKFGFTNPVLIDENNEIIAGHGRVLAMKILGQTQVPCLVLSGLDAEKKRAYIIADNRLAEIGGGWDETMLKQELDALKDIGVDLSTLGFSEVDIQKLYTKEEPVAPEEFDTYDEKIDTEYCCPKCGYGWSGKPR